MKNFTTMLHDRLLLYAQTAEEYNKRFVFPTLFPPKREMATETEESLLTRELFDLMENQTPETGHPLDRGTCGIGREGTSGRRQTMGVGESPMSTPVKPVVSRPRHRRAPLYEFQQVRP